MPIGVDRQALLGPGTVAARVLGHPAVLLGGPRALLLQVAHPSVAAAVVAHSSFRADPYLRLARTFAVMHEISFGSPDRSETAAAGLAEVHRRVRGRTDAGIPYSARDPDLALWVHATLIDTALAVERRYLGELDRAGRDRLYEELTRMGPALGVPAGMHPPDRVAFGRYMATMEDRLLGRELGRDSLEIARGVLNPPPAGRLGPLGPVAARSAARLVEAVTVDLGPALLCRAYGLPDPHREPAARLVLGMVAGGSRLTSPRLPAVLRDPGNLVRLTDRLARLVA